MVGWIGFTSPRESELLTLGEYETSHKRKKNRRKIIENILKVFINEKEKLQCITRYGVSQTYVHPTFKPLNSNQNPIFCMKRCYPIWSPWWGGLDSPHLKKANYSLLVSMKQAIKEKDRRKIVENILKVCIIEKEKF